MKLIVGLGNPGKTYQKSRHNVGFMVLDTWHKRLAKEGQAEAWNLSKKFNAQIAATNVLPGEKVILAKPMTYMNASGDSVGLLVAFYKLSMQDVLVVHDDKDIELGTIKLQTDRGDAGHNGVKSIVRVLGTAAFARLRCGVASSNKKRMGDVSKFVLGSFSLLERKKLAAMIDASLTEIMGWLKASS